jgi:hypothetical protein
MKVGLESSILEESAACSIKRLGFSRPTSDRQHFGLLATVAMLDPGEAIFDHDLAPDRFLPRCEIGFTQRHMPVSLWKLRRVAFPQFVQEKADKTVAVGGERHLDANYDSGQAFLRAGRRLVCQITQLMARPKGSVKKVDLEKLRALALIGASHELIASELGISHDTLTRRFLPLINESRGKGRIKVLGKAFQLATSGNVRLLELFLVNWLGFTLRPETVVTVTQNCGQPATFNAAEFKARFAAAQKYLQEHQDELQRPSGNGERIP